MICEDRGRKGEEEGCRGRKIRAEDKEEEDKEENKQIIYRPENTAPRNEEDEKGKIEGNDEEDVEGGHIRAENKTQIYRPENTAPR